jgi:thiol-disulfide isomerase/thioredoxin
MLYGEITRQELFDEYPNWKENYDDYRPDTAYIDTLSQEYTFISVEIFLGTWCGDSRREVPRFLKIADNSNFISADSVRFFAVDRNKKLDSGRAKKRNIKRVATFIFFHQGREFGRIVERPSGGSLEEDIVNIMCKI